MEFYRKTNFQVSQLVTKAYSTSFSWGIKAFSPEYRDAIYAIYGFVRYADEIVDTFHGYDKEKIFKRFRTETFVAIEDGVSANPILDSFQNVVREYSIDKKYINAFLDSMEMDLSKSTYERETYDDYIYGSAEVVGLMCLQVFVDKDKKLFEDLVEPARALGSAFQKVNFLRDIKSDLDERGRIYLPGIHRREMINDINKRELEEEVEKEFQLALTGIIKLPQGVKLGVYSAYLYYYVLFSKIRSLRTNELMKKRVRVSNFTKILLLLRSLITVRVIKTT